MADLNSAHSFLFVPGDRPERFAKAAGSGAHAIIIDLEDAVAPEAKAEARANVLGYLENEAECPILLRINDAESSSYEADLQIAQHPGLAGIVLPKATARHATELVYKLDRPVWPLVETLQGVVEVADIASLPNIGRLLFGTIDLSLEMGLDMNHAGGKAMLDHARFELIAASRLAKIPAPVDGVFPSLDDPDGLSAAAHYVRATGMGGMMCIHPRQTGAIHDAFVPSPAERDWAQAVIAASLTEKSSFRFRGQMIDKPVLELAQRILRH